MESHTFIDLLKPLPSAQLFTALMLSILFIQSGLDKLFDWKGNLEWLTGHFEKSPLAGMVPFMLGTMTLLELSAGFTSAAGVFVLVFSGSTAIALIGAQLAALSIAMLFFGQRVAKDYVGAATLVPYFLMAVAGIVLMGWTN